MKSKAFVCLLAAGSLTFGSLSFAQGRDHRDNDRRDEQRHDQRHDDRHDNRGGYDRGHDRQDHYYYGARGPEWHRGGRLPATYRSHQYVVNDWRGHHLSAPPRGYQWVQVGNDYVLAAIATGIIAQLLLNN
jgi:Ni/Co efflux regulator RcnB